MDFNIFDKFLLILIREMILIKFTKEFDKFHKKIAVILKRWVHGKFFFCNFYYF